MIGIESSMVDRLTGAWQRADKTIDIGNARIAGLEKDLNLSSRQYEWLLTAFYITYIVFEWMTLMYDLLTSLHHPAMYKNVAVLQLRADLGSWPSIWLFAYGTELHTDRS